MRYAPRQMHEILAEDFKHLTINAIHKDIDARDAFRRRVGEENWVELQAVIRAAFSAGFQAGGPVIDNGATEQREWEEFMEALLE